MPWLERESSKKGKPLKSAPTLVAVRSGGGLLLLLVAARAAVAVMRRFCTIPPAHLLIGGRQRDIFVKMCEEVSPFVKEILGLKVVHVAPGTLEMEFSMRPHHLGNPFSQVLHGGVTAAVLDHVGGFAAWSTLTDPNKLLSTVDLRIDYISPAPYVNGGVLSVVGSVNLLNNVKGKQGRLVRADAELRLQTGQVLALARGLYNIYTVKS